MLLEFTVLYVSERDRLLELFGKLLCERIVDVVVCDGVFASSDTVEYYFDCGDEYQLKSLIKLLYECSIHSCIIEEAEAGVRIILLHDNAMFIVSNVPDEIISELKEKVDREFESIMRKKPHKTETRILKSWLL